MRADEADLLLCTELTLFFERNPFTFETAAGLANKIGREASQVERALAALVAKQILACSGSGVSAVFSYSPPYLRVRDRTTGGVPTAEGGG